MSINRNRSWGLLIHAVINSQVSSGLFSSIDPDTLSPNKTVIVKAENNTVDIHISNLLHKHQFNLQDDLVMIPLQKGNFNIEISTFCAEYIDMHLAVLEILVE